MSFSDLDGSVLSRSRVRIPPEASYHQVIIPIVLRSQMEAIAMAEPDVLFAVEEANQDHVRHYLTEVKLGDIFRR